MHLCVHAKFKAFFRAYIDKSPMISFFHINYPLINTLHSTNKSVFEKKVLSIKNPNTYRQT